MTSSSGDRHFIWHILQDVENHMPDNSKVFGRMVFSHSGMVVPESNIQAPMQRIFYPPMLANRLYPCAEAPLEFFRLQHPPHALHGIMRRNAVFKMHMQSIAGPRFFYPAGICNIFPHVASCDGSTARHYDEFQQIVLDFPGLPRVFQFFELFVHRFNHIL